MQQSSTGKIRLPKELLAQLDINISPSKFGRSHNEPTSRKAQRKAARVEKKSKATRSRHVTQERNDPVRKKFHGASVSTQNRPRQSQQPVTVKPETTDLGTLEASAPSPETNVKSRIPEGRLGKSQKRKASSQLEKDEAEIAALEKKLGISKKKGLPEAFTEDGLAGLLDGLDNEKSHDTDVSSEREIDQDWLRKKRQRPSDGKEANVVASDPDVSGLDDSDGEINTLDGSEADSQLSETPLDVASHPSSISQTNGSLAPNPTVIHQIGSRHGLVQDDAEVLQLQKLARRCVNRLSEANFIATVSEAERLYQDQPRRLVSEALLEATFNHISGRDTLSDAFLILYSGFLAALFKTIGSDFGIEVVRKVTAAAERSLEDNRQVDTSANLLTTLTQLFNFRVIASELVYDFVRVFVTEITERNTQLLLRIMKVCGPQLRQEDPSSLKDIVIHLQAAVAKIPSQDMSVRSKFMIEMITDLKNNKSKPALNAAGLAQEQIHRMKKLLASMGHGQSHTLEPLRISLSDLHDSTKTGQWWLAGAKHRKPTDAAAVSQPNDREKGAYDIQDMQDLASDQRMNTDIRRSIFVSLMSASDGKDAHSRILALSLKKSQDLEIPKVLIHCLTTEEHYNPYYAFVAEQLCAERRMRISFQITLWNALRQTGNEDEEDDLLESPSLRSLVHIAKLFGELVARQLLDLKGLKNLEFATIPARMQAFLEVFLLTIILRAHRKREHQRQTILNIFQPLCDSPGTARAVRHFVHSTVRKSDMAASQSERDRILHGCEVVDEILRGI